MRFRARPPCSRDWKCDYLTRVGAICRRTLVGQGLTCRPRRLHSLTGLGGVTDGTARSSCSYRRYHVPIPYYALSDRIDLAGIVSCPGIYRVGRYDEPSTFWPGEGLDAGQLVCNAKRERPALGLHLLRERRVVIASASYIQFGMVYNEHSLLETETKMEKYPDDKRPEPTIGRTRLN